MVKCRGGYHYYSSGWGGPKRSLKFRLLFKDRSLSLRGDLSLSPRLLGLCSRFFSLMLFSFYVGKFSHLDRRASSPLMYFSTLASTSAMLALRFFEMESIRSFDYTRGSGMKAVMANFSSGMSTFKDSLLKLWT